MRTRSVLLVLLVLPAYLGFSDENPALPFRDAQKALQKAFEYIDSGKVQFKDNTIKHGDVEPVSVSYGFEEGKNLISVDFRVKSAVKSNYSEYVHGMLSVQLDEHGKLRGQSTYERHGTVPSKQWKITP
jgi:hypothetical protein